MLSQNFISISFIVTFLIITSHSHANECETHSTPFIKDKYNHMWCAKHETEKFDEYSWKHQNTICSRSDIVEDPTASGRGHVYRGQIFCSSIESSIENHRIYPTLNLKECLYGPYKSSFMVWADIDDINDFGWISLATYTNKKNWQDLFGLNLVSDNGIVKLIIFHVPIFGKSKYEKVSDLGFPLKKWVHLALDVDRDGIRVYQDGKLVIKARKRWGNKGPAVCESHWGLYADAKTNKVLILNDDIFLISYGNPLP